MPTTRKKSHPARRRPGRARATAARKPANRIRDTWEAAVEAVTGAEAEAERQLRLMLARKHLRPADARAALEAFGTRVEKERRKAARELDSRVTTIQGRLRKERKNLVRMVEDAVRGTLASLNIPSRREVAELTHKVDALSRKIDGFRRRTTGRSARRAGTAAAATSH